MYMYVGYNVPMYKQASNLWFRVTVDHGDRFGGD